jgi:hypothetical protein
VQKHFGFRVSGLSRLPLIESGRNIASVIWVRKALESEVTKR